MSNDKYIQLLLVLISAIIMVNINIILYIYIVLYVDAVYMLVYIHSFISFYKCDVYMIFLYIDYIIYCI